MEEIIFELKDHSAGLNCGRWDYIFSYIKKLGMHEQFILPDRQLVTMEVPFMSAYVTLLIKTCHKRRVHAMGGMAAQIPIKHDATANAQAMRRVKEDKLREAKAGHDGTWVAHPDLIPIAKEAFDLFMPQPNQMFVGLNDVSVTAQDLLQSPRNPCVTLEGIKNNVSVALTYMESWLRGQGCVQINNLMEDAATAEIARAQLWQWLHHGVLISESQTAVSSHLIRKIVNETLGPPNSDSICLGKAKNYLIKLVEDDDFYEFLTFLCYKDLVMFEAPKSKL